MLLWRFPPTHCWPLSTLSSTRYAGRPFSIAFLVDMYHKQVLGIWGRSDHENHGLELSVFAVGVCFAVTGVVLLFVQVLPQQSYLIILIGQLFCITNVCICQWAHPCAYYALCIV